MRQAEVADVEAAAVLCKEFADDSVSPFLPRPFHANKWGLIWRFDSQIYFPLELPGALKEARELIRNRQLWVYYMAMPDGRQELASIVACTRTSENVAAITKVYTNPVCRSRGCAERLVRRVCE